MLISQASTAVFTYNVWLGALTSFYYVLTRFYLMSQVKHFILLKRIPSVLKKKKLKVLNKIKQNYRQINEQKKARCAKWRMKGITNQRTIYQLNSIPNIEDIMRT